MAEELPPVPLTVFYSKDDPKWKDAEKIIEAVGRELPRLQINKISYDDEKGYAQLSEVEQSHHVSDPGEITLVLGPYVLVSRGERRDVETYFGPMVRRSLNPKAGKGRLKVDAAASAAEVFGKDAKIEAAEKLPGETLDANWFSVNSRGKRIGWVADVYWPVACPVCNDTQFLIAVSLPEQKVLDVRPVRELERLGRTLEVKEVAGFTDQFKGFTPECDAAKAKVDIISGATKTSLTYQAALAQVLGEVKKREAK